MNGWRYPANPANENGKNAAGRKSWWPAWIALDCWLPQFRSHYVPIDILGRQKQNKLKRSDPAAARRTGEIREMASPGRECTAPLCWLNSEEKKKEQRHSKQNKQDVKINCPTGSQKSRSAVFHYKSLVVPEEFCWLRVVQVAAVNWSAARHRRNGRDWETWTWSMSG